MTLTIERQSLLHVPQEPTVFPPIKVQSETQQIASDTRIPLQNATGIPATTDLFNSPRQEKIKYALMKALNNDQQIDAKEACEIRGLLLELSKGERKKYQPLLEKLNITPYARPILLDIDPDLELYQKDFNPEEIKLIDSLPFKKVFANFNQLSMKNRRAVIDELKPFMTHFPNVLNHLNTVKNENYGPGYQIFFVDSQSNKELGQILPFKGIAGIIMPGVQYFKNPALKFVMAPFLSHSLLDRGGMLESGLPFGIFSHEFAHVIHLHMLSDDQRDHIKNLYDGAWEQSKETDNQQGFVSGYAKTNPYEYFAEGLEDYLTNDGILLQQKDPALHRFIADLFATGVTHDGKNGNLFTDPEKVSYVASFRNGKFLNGISLSHESEIASLKHFEGGVVTDMDLTGNEDSLLLKGSLGIKAAWKPWTKPAGVYGVIGGTVYGGIAGHRLAAGVGGFAGVGVEYKFLNAELRHNLMLGPDATEIRAGIRFEF